MAVKLPQESLLKPRNNVYSRQDSGEQEEKFTQEKKRREEKKSGNIDGGEERSPRHDLAEKGAWSQQQLPTSCAHYDACAGSNLPSTSRGFSRRGLQRWSSPKTKKQLSNLVEPTNIHIMPSSIPSTKYQKQGPKDSKPFMELCQIMAKGQRPTNRSS